MINNIFTQSFKQRLVILPRQKDKDNKDKNIFGWKDKDKDIKIIMFLRQFKSEFMYFQNRRYGRNISLETIFIIFHS